MFTRWGGFVYRRRRWLVVLAFVIAGGLGSLAGGAADELSNGGWLDPTSESAQVADRLEADYGGGRSAFIALFGSSDPDADATSPDFQAAIATTLAPVLQVEGVTGLTGYAETQDSRFISTAGNAAYVVIGLDVDEDSSIDLVDPVKAALATPAGYEVKLTGFGPIQQDSARLSEEDLVRAETVSLPIAALVLLLVFGSLIAAGMPLLVAGLAIPTSVGLINLVAQQTEMSIYVLNIATMLGLALAIDYSLFLASRFREELARGRTVEQAVERAVGTAGKAVLFSGIAVAIGLSGLLWFQASGLSSIGLGGAIVVVASVFYSLTFLPAILGMLGPRVNALSVGGLLRRLGLRREAPGDVRAVALGAGRARRHAPPDRRARAGPRRSCCSSARRTCGCSRASRTPRSIPTACRAATRGSRCRTEFRAGETTPIVILLDTSGDADQRDVDRGSRGARRAPDGARWHRPGRGPIRARRPGDGRADGAGAGRAALRGAARHAAAGARRRPRALRETYIRGSTVRIDAISPLSSAEPAATGVISESARSRLDPPLTRMQVGGGAAHRRGLPRQPVGADPVGRGDDPARLGGHPVPALRLAGHPDQGRDHDPALADGELRRPGLDLPGGQPPRLLDFEPLGYTIAGNPIIMFAVLIGLSMDYEVLLLSRIQEAYRRTGDNAAAVADGLAKTAGVITGAALIMVTVFAAFALADTVTIKSIGVGMALAVALDATIVRVLLVPGDDAPAGPLELVGARPARPAGRALRVQPRRGRGGSRRRIGRERTDEIGAGGSAGLTLAQPKEEGGMDTSDREPDPLGNAAATPPPKAGGVRSYGWEWGRDEDRQPQLPWIGIFLVVSARCCCSTGSCPSTSPRERPRAGRRPCVPAPVAAPPRHVPAVCRGVPDGRRRPGPRREPWHRVAAASAR